MKLCNDTITLYNAYYNREADCTAYARTVLSGVSWYKTARSTASDKELKRAVQCTIRIPAEISTGYVKPSGYTGSGWTLEDGDIIVHGVCALENPTPAEIFKMYEDEAVTVQSVTDNRRAPNAPHWRVVAA